MRPGLESRQFRAVGRGEFELDNVARHVRAPFENQGEPLAPGRILHGRNFL